MIVFHIIAVIVTTAWHVAAAIIRLWWLLPLALAARLGYGLIRFALLPREAKRHYPAALWVRFRWRWLCRNLGLAYLDQHRRAVQPIPLSTSVRTFTPARPCRLRYPRASIRADEFGLTARCRTVPKTGRQEFSDMAEHVANYWRCVRVQVAQPKPGRLIIRGLRTDPLTVPYAMTSAPPGVFEATAQVRAPGGPARLRKTAPIRPVPLRLYIGRDEWSEHRWRHLPGLTGITVGGLPGYGKTSLILSWLMQLAPLPVQFVFIDGKGLPGDYEPWRDRAWIHVGDDLPAAAGALEDVHSLMRSRLATVQQITGRRNAWHASLSPAFPLIFTVIDECHTFFDLDAVKGDRKAEQYVRTCRTMAGQLVRKGRSVLMITVLITQKQTSDAIPTAIRDNCGLGLSFATKTLDASKAALGEQIKDHPGFDPVTLQAMPDYVGACTASLPTGADPFVRLRVPEVSEEAATARAAQTASLRCDPSGIPSLAPSLADLAACTVGSPGTTVRRSPILLDDLTRTRS